MALPLAFRRVTYNQMRLEGDDNASSLRIELDNDSSIQIVVDYAGYILIVAPYLLDQFQGHPDETFLLARRMIHNL